MEGYFVHEAGTYVQGLETMRRERCKVLVSDVSLPDGSGLDLMREIARQFQGVRGLAVSGHFGPEHVREARRAGFERYVAKPLQFDEVLPLIEAMLVN